MTVREQMFLLPAAGALYMVFGDLREGLALSGFSRVTLGLAFLHEGGTERAIEALRDMSGQRGGERRWWPLYESTA